MKAILGIKKGMTRVYDGDLSVPVTVVDVTGCKVCNITADGIELGIGKKKANTALQGKYKDLGYVPMYRSMFDGLDSEHKIGDDVVASMFEGEKTVNINATAKGKGFAGVVKRWGFHGGPKTHGQSDRHRSGGSVGAGTDPGRIIKGHKMAGRKGGNSVTLKNKKLIKIVDNYILLKGPIPGNNGDLVVIKK